MGRCLKDDDKKLVKKPTYTIFVFCSTVGLAISDFPLNLVISFFGNLVVVILTLTKSKKESNLLLSDFTLHFIQVFEYVHVPLF